MNGPHLCIKNQKLKKIPVKVLINNEFSSLDLSFNPIQTLEKLPSLPNLRRLILNHTSIQTFLGTVPQINLLKVELRNSPINENKFCRVMAAIVFGKALGFVNGKPLNSKEIQFRNQYTLRLKQYLVTGYVITDTEPIHLYCPYTDVEKVLYPVEHLLGKSPKIEDELIHVVKARNSVTCHIYDTDPVDVLKRHKLQLDRFTSNISPKKLNFSSDSDDGTEVFNDSDDLETSEDIQMLGKVEHEVTEELFEDGYMSGDDGAYCYPQPIEDVQ